MFTEKGLQKTDSLTTNNLINSKLRSTILTCKTTPQTTQMEFKLKKKILHLPMKKTELANLAHLTNLQTAKNQQIAILLSLMLRLKHHFLWNKVCSRQIKIKKKTTCLPKNLASIKLTSSTPKTHVKKQK
jgi:hypothetical protein